LDQYDVDSISEMKSKLNQLTVAQVLDAVSAANAVQFSNMWEICGTFDHYGYLVFPETISEVVAVLDRNGLAVDPPVPSVVVKSRLCSRYLLHPSDIDVRIVRGGFVTDRFGRREIEIFAVMATPGCTLPEGMVDRERQSMNESHVAIMVDQPERTLATLRRQLLDSGALVADGAGYNPFEKPHEGGRSVLYFRRREVPSEQTFAHRLELTCAGEYANLIADHVRASDSEMVTGAH
jgi:hypothetical protein